MIQNIPNKFKPMACYKSNTQPIPVEDNSLRFTATEASNIVLSSVGSPSSITLQYNKNGTGWSTYNVGDQIDLDTGQYVKFSGANDHFSQDTSNYYRFYMTGTVEASENIQSLVNFSDNVPSGCFIQLFYYCNRLVDASNLILPVNTLSPSCYYEMFRNCSSLSAAPVLPATGLADDCYAWMFGHCSSLVTPPVLPATGLATRCYYQMFRGCKSLTSVPALPATTMALRCYLSMFEGCTSLSSVPVDLLPATTLETGCYQAMFSGCTALTSAPALPATNKAFLCYQNMFRDCSSLTNIDVNFTSWDNTSNWVDGVAANGTFTCPTALGTNQTIERGSSNCPNNWTVINK